MAYNCLSAALKSEKQSSVTLKSEQHSFATLESEQQSSATLKSEKQSCATLKSEQQSSATLKSEQQSFATLKSEQHSIGTLKSEQQSFATLKSEQRSIGTLKSAQHSSATLKSIQLTEKSESYYQVKLDTLNEIESCTKQLLNKLKTLKDQTPKTGSVIVQTETFYSPNILKKPLERWKENENQSKTASKVLTLARSSEVQTNDSEEGCFEYMNDEYYNYGCECSIFNKLCRKCTCLRDRRYNDFIIHFNENTKYTSSTLGEVIKNTRILKKFLYMGGNYTTNTLTFLTEGLSESTINDKLEIILACAYTDICNIFEESSIVNTYLSWPNKFKYWGDSTTQYLTAKFLYQLAEIVEGKDYLTLNTKIEKDLNQVLKTARKKLEQDTVNYINNTLILISPVPMCNVNVNTYYCETERAQLPKPKTNFVKVKDFAHSLPQYAIPVLRRNQAGFIEIRIENNKIQQQ